MEFTAWSLLELIATIILKLFRWGGMLLIIWGICQFVLSIKKADADSKSDAIHTIICAIALIMLELIIYKTGILGVAV